MISIMTGVLEAIGGGVEGFAHVTSLAVVGSAVKLAPTLSLSSSSFHARNDSFVCNPIKSGSLHGVWRQ